MPKLELGVNDLYFNTKKKKWDEAIKEFILDTTELLQTKWDEDNLEEMQEELHTAKGAAISYLYMTRKYRDSALAKGYEKYPKPQYNSEAQVAMARAFASAEVRLHELVKDICEAIKERIYSNAKRIEMRKLD